MMPDLHTQVINTFDLPGGYSRDLAAYYILHWELEYLLSKLTEDPSAMIEHNGQWYVPILPPAYPVSMKAQMKLSFRLMTASLRATHKIPNYVLIKAA